MNCRQEIRKGTQRILLCTNVDLDTEDAEVKLNGVEHKPSFWKPKAPKAWWKERILLSDLEVGQELSGHVVQEYLEAKTGPKLFFECGVGRIDRNGDWSMVNGMLRLDRGKASVARKRAARFRKRDKVQLFVSRIQKECGRLEVCAKVEDVQKYAGEPKISVSTLEKNQEVTGKVLKLYPYGAIIDIGANVRGLLHITKVAHLMNQFIDKEKGLKTAGLEKGAEVRLMVESVEKRRLSLDFTEDVKESARKELAAKLEAEMEAKLEAEKMEEQQVVDESDDSQNVDLNSWAAYANDLASNEKQEEEVADNSVDDDDDGDDDEDEYDYDEYDEEMDIESSLGLDMY